MQCESLLFLDWNNIWLRCQAFIPVLEANALSAKQIRSSFSTGSTKKGLFVVGHGGVGGSQRERSISHTVPQIPQRLLKMIASITTPLDTRNVLQENAVLLHWFESSVFKPTHILITIRGFIKLVTHQITAAYTCKKGCIGTGGKFTVETIFQLECQCNMLF